MTDFQTYLAKVSLGSAMVSIGFTDFKKAPLPPQDDFLSRFDQKFLSSFSTESQTNIKRAIAALVILSGAFVCITALFDWK